MSETPASTPEAATLAIDRAVSFAEFSPRRQRLSDLPGSAVPDSGELIRHRFLCRGGSCLFVGATGAGKSSFLMQCALNWTLGRGAFGLEPVRPLAVWLVQAENDVHDLGEMRDGVCRSLAAAGLASALDLAAAAGRIDVFTEDTVCGDAFGRYLDAILAAAPKGDRPDLLIVDPALAYLGGDANSQADVSHWLRNILSPVLHRHEVGLILCHHTTKPQTLRPGTGPSPSGSDFAYLGAGSAELANWARSVLTIQSVKDSDGLYILRAAKRGKRLRWVGDDGEGTLRRYLAHAKEPGAIYWRHPDPDEIPPEACGKGRGHPPRKLEDLIMPARGLVLEKPMLLATFRAECRERFSLGLNAATQLMTLAQSRGALAKRRVKSEEGMRDIIGLPDQIERTAAAMQEAKQQPTLPGGG